LAVSVKVSILNPVSSFLMVLDNPILHEIALLGAVFWDGINFSKKSRLDHPLPFTRVDDPWSPQHTCDCL